MAALAASNPRVRRLRRLSGRRSARLDDGAFVIEGPTLVAEAIEAGAGVEGLFVEVDTPELDEVVDRARAAGVPIHELQAGVVAGITDSVTPRPVLAVVTTPESDIDGLVDGALQRGRPMVLLVDVRDPGNVGTILRAAEASGAAGVICCRGTADPWSPKVVRSSAGAVLHVPLSTGHDPVDVLALLAARGVPTVAAVVRDGSDPDHVDLSGTVALVLGNEAAGLDPASAAACDERVTIPMDGRAESLNVAMAASVLCFEAARRRRVLGATGTDWTAAAPDDKVIRP